MSTTAVSHIADIDVAQYKEKLMKAVLKEGGKKAQDIAGVADMGGLDFFCMKIESPEGNVDLTRLAVDAMNAECEPDAEERRGGAGHVGKMIVSSSDKVAVAMVCCIPEDKQQKLKASAWLGHVCSQIQGMEMKHESDGYAYAELKYDPDAGVFPLKEKDNAIAQSTQYLRAKGLMQDVSDDSDEMVFGDDFDCDACEDAGEEPAEAAAAPAIDLSPYKEKKLKAVLKEGGKKAQDMEGAADMGGLDFFCMKLEMPEGDVTLLRAAVDAMNAEIDPEAEERRGGAGHIGKMIVSSSDKVGVAMVCTIPKEKITKLTAKAWVEQVASTINGMEVLYASDGYAYALMKYDPDAGHFPLKEKDNAVAQSTQFLRAKGLMPDVSDDSDEMVFGDDFDCDACEDAGEEPAEAAAAPAIDLSPYKEKKLKAVLKEGGKKAQDMEGAADMGGLDFFCMKLEMPEGDVTLLRAAVDAMNAEIDPEAEERRGGAGHIGKMIVSSSDKVGVAMVCTIPKEKITKLTAKAWVEQVASTINGMEVLYASDGYAYALMKYDPDAGHFPLKEKDNAVAQSTQFLRAKGLMPDVSDDSDEMVFGDDFDCDAC